MRGIKHLSKSVLVGVASFAATSAFIVTFAVTAVVQNTPTGSETIGSASGAPATPRPYTPRFRRTSDTVDPGNGTQASSGAPTPSGSTATDEPAAPEDSQGTGIKVPVDTSQLDPALRSLLGDDIPDALNDVVGTVDDQLLPSLELQR